jgi:hypothetical protein
MPKCGMHTTWYTKGFQMYVAEKKLLKIVPEFCLLPDELLCKEK